MAQDREMEKKDARRDTLEQERERSYALIRLKLGAGRLRLVNWLNILAVLGAVGALFVAGLLLEKPTQSALEKRDLAQFPQFSPQALWQGDYTRQIETWFADTFPFRDAFVGLAASTEELYGLRWDDLRIVAPAGGEQQLPAPSRAPEQPAPSQPASPSQPEEQLTSSAPAPSQPEEQPASSAPQAQQPPVPDDGGELSSMNNGIVVYQGRAMSLYGGSYESAAWYASVLNTYQQELEGVQVYNMLIPTAVEFYLPQRYRDLSQSELEMIGYIYGQLDPAIKRVDAYGEIAQHTEEYLYFRTDHHWTGLGAYYAYRAFCQQAGFTPLELGDFETRRLDNFIGTMYAQTQDNTLLENPDYVDYYLFGQPYTAQMFPAGSPYVGTPWNLWGEYAQGVNSYSVFLQGDFPLIQVQTSIENGRKILVVKESFGNAFAPFLINHYEEVYVVDQRYFQLGLVDFIREHGITELCFANNIYAACTPYHIRCIDGLRHQVYQGAPPPAQPAEPQPQAAASQPEAVTSQPEAVTSQPEAIASQPEATASQPEKPPVLPARQEGQTAEAESQPQRPKIKLFRENLPPPPEELEGQ
ncbi:MAG TPA: hypothetical protein H9736_08005 [Candidatus Anaerotruncus excrementipullorum]|uniref:AlgX/AlgJ SGNH hydrolase-like domain-containing protein n=1 Tax=Candidatus Anaerotruncus excrementipullorum TaxID=2838465 RepID=A0A9D2B7S1_9FIRM|nr:hypothetical protein [Candidatus Anaerotruncus excrementipullorum]